MCIRDSYCAALYANLEIVERHNHSLLVSYLPPGLDATIAEGVLDLKFKNSTPYPIKIAASAASGTVTFSIWGYNPERYSVELLRSGGGYSYQVTRVVKKDGAEVARQKMSSSLYNKPEEEEKKEEPPRQTQEMCIRDSTSSIRWALQPTIRAIANSGVYNSSGSPII